MSNLPKFLTYSQVDIEIERLTGGTRNDLGELEDMYVSTVSAVGVIDSLMEPGYTGRYVMDDQGKDTRQRFRLLVGPLVSLQTGDFVTFGDVRYEVGVVSGFESHSEAIMFKV